MKYILSTLLLIVVLLGIILNYFNLFDPVTFVEQENKRYILAYEKHKGSYSTVGDKILTIATKLSSHNFGCTTKFGIYWDNPQEVEESELRSLVGCVVPVTDSLEITTLAESFDLADYKPVPSVIAQFPYKSDLSILFGILKVYPPLTEFLIEKGYSHGPIMELYNKADGYIQYVSPQKADRAFYDALLGIFEK
ncbi:MAG: hypothetical protein OCD01_12300 [Fibrobacterales bacterium]